MIRTPNVLEYTTSTNSTPSIIPTSLTNTAAGVVDGILLGLKDGEVVTTTGLAEGEVVTTIGLAEGEVVTTIGLAEGEVVVTTIEVAEGEVVVTTIGLAEGEAVVTATGLVLGEVVTITGLWETGTAVAGMSNVGEPVSAKGAGDRGLDVS